MNIINVLDVVASVGTVVSLYLVGKYRKAWILYSASSVAFTIVCIDKHLVGLTIMGCILFVLGIRNYWLGGKKC